MRKLIVTLALVVPFCMAHAQVANGPTEAKNYEFAHGQWFDGQKFVVKKFYTVGGKLTSKKPSRVDSVIDLSGKYVVPPFGEAHNHNLAQSSRLDSFIRMYLEAGIFYVKNPNVVGNGTRSRASVSLLWSERCVGRRESIKFRPSGTRNLAKTLLLRSGEKGSSNT